jgi:putative cell wall-binding protein
MTQMAYGHADHVVLATSAKFADALAAGAIAAKLDGVLLLTDPSFLPGSIAAEIQRLGANTVTIVGGAAAITVEVEDAVRQLGVDVRRIGGANRFSTAAMLSAATFDTDTDTVYIATGLNYPDALAGVPAAASRGAPILLVSDAVPGAVVAELNRLKPTRVYILGGPVAVSDSVVAQVESITGVTATRLGGANRYGTALKVSRDAFGPDVETVFLVPGNGFLDALIAGPVAHRLGGPLILTAGSLPGGVYGEIARLKPDRIVIVGSQVSDGVIKDLDGIGPSLATELIGYLPRP